MAKQYSAGFNAHIAQEVLTLCTCWLLTLRDGRNFGFTDLDFDLVIAGVTYQSGAGFSRTASQNTADASVQNFDLASILSSSAITPADLLAGDYDGATVRIFYANYYSLPASLTTTPLDYHPLSIGTLGEFSTDGQAFTAQFRGLLDKFNQASAWLTSETCRYQLGDSKCGVNLGSFTSNLTIAQIVDQRTIVLSGSAPAIADWFAEGTLTFASGPNMGNTYQINSYAPSRQVILYEPVRRAMAIGDSVTVVAGCDKRNATCHSKFSNGINFGGEPHVPGWDATATGKGTQTTTGGLTPPAPAPAEVNQSEPALFYSPPPVFTMTSNNAPSPFVVSASSNFNGLDPWRAFNRTTANGLWASQTNQQQASPQWLQVDLGTEYLISGVRLTPREFINQQLPLNFEILGSSNGASFATLLTATTTQAEWAALTARTFNFANTVAARFVRFRCTLSNGGNQFVSLNEMEVF